MLVEARENNLNDLVKEGFVIVDFYGETCGPCKILAPFLNRLESEFPFITVVKVNTTKYPNYSEELKITAVPTLMFYNNGELKERHLGVLSIEQLEERMSKYMYE